MTNLTQVVQHISVNLLQGRKEYPPIVSVTYSELVDLINNNSLKGCKYCITDYRMRHQIKDSVTYYEGEVENIIVTPTSNNTLSYRAESLDYPDDEIFYTVSNIWYDNDNGPDRGVIYWRHDFNRSVSAPFDWKSSGYRVRLWEKNAGEGDFFWTVDPGNGEIYQDFPISDMVNYGFNEIHLKAHWNMSSDIEKTQEAPSMPRIVFQGDAYKVITQYGCEDLVSRYSVWDLTAGCCSTILLYNGGRQLNFGNNSGLVAEEYVERIQLSSNRIVLHGGCVQCHFAITLPNSLHIWGDHFNESFGADYGVSHELLADGGFDVPGSWSTENGIIQDSFYETTTEDTLTDTASTAPVVGVTYVLEFKIPGDFTDGVDFYEWTVYVGGFVQNMLSKQGLYRFSFVATATNNFEIITTGALSIQYVSLKRVTI